MTARQGGRSKSDVEHAIESAFGHSRDVGGGSEADEARKERNWDAIAERLGNANPATATASPRMHRRLSKTGAGAAAAAAVVVAGYGVYALVGRATFTEATNTHPPAQHVHSTTSKSKPRFPPTQALLPGYEHGTGVRVPSKVANMYSPFVAGAAPFSDVSPDGNWVIEINSQNTGFVLESADGKVKRNINSAADVIYGETPNGDLVLGGDAGGGGVIEVMNPTTGAETPLPGNMDTAAHWAYRAQQSVSGDWAITMGNSNGAGPGQEIWVDVNGQKVPGLNAAFDYAWSPDGRKLAVLVPPPFGAKTLSTGMLDLYDPSTGAITPLASASQVSAPPANADNGPPLGSVGPVWSPDGRYILYADGANPGLVDVQTGAVIHLPVKQVGSIGFLPNGEVFVVTGSSLDKVQLFKVQGDRAITGWGFQLSGQIDQVAPAGSGLIVGAETPNTTGANTTWTLTWLGADGQMASSAQLFHAPVDSWWYDDVSHLVYLHPAEDGATNMSTLDVGNTLQAGVSTSNTSGGQS